ncbi:MAG: hypothetical protein K2X49_16455 [Acetobacteraceae bacterium]|nr:hypothetical protein [Acetobacteraceae bacterium]
MPDDVAAALAPHAVTAALNYLRPPADGSRPYRYVDEPPPGRPRTTIEIDPREMRIEDISGREHLFSLDANGFAVLDAPTAVADLTDDTLVRTAYRAEVEALLRARLGASRVVMFDHTIRGQGPADAGGMQRVRDLLPEEADALLARRFAIVNLWRPIGLPAIDSPLALCDAASLDAERDLVVNELIYPDRVGQTFSVRWHAAHRWHYRRGLRPDQALLIKGHDSATDGRARLSAHGAFDDPETPPGTPPRQSIEVRTLVFWDAKADG